MKLYEAMYVVRHDFARNNYEEAETEVKRTIEKNGGTIVECVKWDDRRLAYEIKHQRKFTYILVHFNAPPDVISKIEQTVRLTENILRVLIVRDTDGINKEREIVAYEKPDAVSKPVAVSKPEAVSTPDAVSKPDEVPTPVQIEAKEEATDEKKVNL